MSKQEVPEINAGSMADIAFLLLIFFLVTTTMDIDSGIFRKIPEKLADKNIIIKEKNILLVNINKNNQLLVNNEFVKISQLKQIAIDFIDNGAGLDKEKKPCDWCQGKKNPKSSDHPSKAFISIKTDRVTQYGTYISALDQLISANTFLRNKLSTKMYNTSYTSLLKKFKTATKNRGTIKQKIDLIRKKYPLLVSDTQNTN